VINDNPHPHQTQLHPHDENTSIRTRLGRAALRTVVGVALVGPLTLASAVRADDAQPFTPSATISSECTQNGLGVTVHIDNTGSATPLDFAVDVDEFHNTFTTAAGVAEDTFFGLSEDDAGVITVSGAGLTTTTATVGPVNCFDGFATLELVCAADGSGKLRATMHNTGQVEAFIVLVVDNDDTDPSGQALPGGVLVLEKPLTEGRAFDASVFNGQKGTEVTLSGVENCTPKPKPGPKPHHHHHHGYCRRT